MTLVLALAIVLIFICGWKIFALEAEERAIAEERLLLDRDRDSFLTWGGELPQIEERHSRLLTEVSKYEDRQKYLAKAVEELEAKREELNAATHDLMGVINELQGQKQTVITELADTRAELQRLRPEQASTQKEVETLKAQQAALNANIAQKQKQEAALVANLEGLERSREHASAMLEKMTGDKEALASFEKRLDNLTGKFDGVVAKAAELNGSFAAKLEDVNRFQARMDHGVAALEMDVQALAANLDSIKKDRTTWDVQLKTITDQNKALQAQADSLAQINKKLSAAIEAAGEMDRRFQATLVAEAAVLNKMVQEDSQTRAQLGSASHALEQGASQLRQQLGEARDDASQIRNLLSTQKGELEAVASAVKSVAAQLEQGRQGMETSLKAGAALSQAAQTLNDQAETLKARVKLVDTHGGHMEKQLDAQNTRLNELGQVARDLGAEIRENRRQGLAVEALLDQIQAALLKLGVIRPGQEPPAQANGQPSQEAQ